MRPALRWPARIIGLALFCMAAYEGRWGGTLLPLALFLWSLAPPTRVVR